MREKAIKNTIICAYKNLKSKAYKKIVMALMIFMAAMQVGIISNNKVKAAQTENNQYEINIALKNENVIFADREVRIYKIAEKKENDKYILSGAFAKYPIEVNDIKNNSDLSKIANTISGYISLDGITADYVGTTNEQGKMKYEKVKNGMYLMLIDACVEQDKMYEFVPQIIAIPYINDNNELQQSIDVEPKSISKNIESKEQESKKDERKRKNKGNTAEKQSKENEQTTTVKYDNKLPQTGQDRAIAVILAAVGLVMIAGGVVVIKRNR